MSFPPDLSSDEDRGPYEDVYEQYWSHARHVENEMWLYTRIWALILTGIFTIIGTDLPATAKGAAALFGALLSVLGYLIIYSLRVPFLAFALTSEVLAINEFDLQPEYRRFFRSGANFRSEKGVDLPEILLFIYGLVAVALIFAAGRILQYTIVGVAAAASLAVLLLISNFLYIRPRFKKEKVEAYNKIDGKKR